jgi:hypothetical protein
MTVRPQKESAMAKTAFAAYAAMGPTRNLRGLVTELRQNFNGKPSFRQIGTWSSTFHWQERIRAHDDAVAAAVGAQLVERWAREAAEQRDLRLELCAALLRKLYDYFADPETELKDMDPRMVNAAVRALTVVSAGQRIDYGHALATSGAAHKPNVQVQKAIILSREEAREWIDSFTSSADDRDLSQPVIESVPYDFSDPGFWRRADDPLLPAASESDGVEIVDFQVTRAG